MLTRLWLVLSLGWAALMMASEYCPGDPYETEAGHEMARIGAIAPLVIGLVLKRVGKYVVTGR